jgi:hypothetical protein
MPKNIETTSFKDNKNNKHTKVIVIAMGYKIKTNNPRN